MIPTSLACILSTPHLQFHLHDRSNSNRPSLLRVNHPAFIQQCCRTTLIQIKSYVCFSSVAMEFDLEFNSSDVEFDPPSKPYIDLGARGIAKQRGDPTTVRLRSKKSLKELSYSHKALSAQKFKALWSNRWDSFYNKILSKEEDCIPIGADIVRFLIEAPNYVVSRHLSVPDAFSYN